MNRLPETLLLEWAKLRLKKQEAIKKQKWEEASITRDLERQLSKKLSCMINLIDEDPYNYDWNSYDNNVILYCENLYGSRDMKSIIRTIKLNIINV
jgi:hypothetical protein